MKRKEKLSQSTKVVDIPTLEQVTRERNRLKDKKNYAKSVWTTVFVLLIAAAITILIATMCLPVLQVSGNSMEPSLSDGEIVLVLKSRKFETGELIGFYYQNKILLKRAVASAGDYVDISPRGTVSVNGTPIQEPYVDEKAMGQCDIKLPYQVPDGQIFVMGDHRETSIDSRSSEIGCVKREQVVGKVVFRIWPLERIGFIS